MKAGDQKPPLPLREQHRQETRRRILDAVRDLFRAPGFARTTMEEIAERAGVSRATLFNYFPTKQSLLFPLIEQIQEGRVRPEVQAALEPWPGVVEALRVAFASVERHIFSLPDLRAALRDAVLAPRKPDAPRGDRRDLVLEILERSARQGELRRDLPQHELARYVRLAYVADRLGPRADCPGEDPQGLERVDELLRFLAPAIVAHQRSRPTS
ncbi:MAG: TetR/AcrR family transcriptional regulator [Candidatus Dormibacteraceae bacterium]